MLVAVVLLAGIGCVREKIRGGVLYKINLKFLDSEGNVLDTAIVRDKDLYLFGKQGYIRKIARRASSTYLLEYDKDETITIVGWGNVINDSLSFPELSPGMPLSECKVKLKQNADGTHVPVPDIFYLNNKMHGGEIIGPTKCFSRKRSMSESTITLIMSRLSAGVSLRTRYLSERYPYTGGERRIVVRCNGTEIDFSGKISGGEAGYLPGCTTDTKGDMYAPPFFILTGSEYNPVQIEVYESSGHRLCTVTKDNHFEELYVTRGKQTNIEIDFRYARPSINITIVPWNEVWQDTEL